MIASSLSEGQASQNQTSAANRILASGGTQSSALNQRTVDNALANASSITSFDSSAIQPSKRQLLTSHVGATLSANATAVPEPSMFLVFAIATAVIVFRLILSSFEASKATAAARKDNGQRPRDR